MNIIKVNTRVITYFDIIAKSVNSETYFYDFLEQNGLSTKESVKDYFITFLDVPKLGIFPTSKFSTPLGIYAYPLVGKDIYYNLFVKQKFDSKTFPFGFNRPFYCIFKNLGSNTTIYASSYTDAQFVADYSIISKHFDLYKGVASIADAAIICRDELSLEFEDNVMNFFHPFQRLLSYVTAGTLYQEKNNNSYRQKSYNITAISKLKFYKNNLGYTGLIDDLGLGAIHPNEPEQAVFFDLKQLEIGTISKNKNITSSKDLGLYKNTESLREDYKDFLDTKYGQTLINSYIRNHKMLTGNFWTNLRNYITIKKVGSKLEVVPVSLSYFINSNRYNVYAMFNYLTTFLEENGFEELVKILDTSKNDLPSQMVEIKINIVKESFQVFLNNMFKKSFVKKVMVKITSSIDNYIYNKNYKVTLMELKNRIKNIIKQSFRSIFYDFNIYNNEEELDILTVYFMICLLTHSEKFLFFIMAQYINKLTYDDRMYIFANGNIQPADLINVLVEVLNKDTQRKIHYELGVKIGSMKVLHIMIVDSFSSKKFVNYYYSYKNVDLSRPSRLFRITQKDVLDIEEKFSYK